MALNDFFVWGNRGQQLTPEEIEQRRQLEAALLSRGGIDTSPIGSPLEGIGRVVNAAAGAYRRNRLEGAAKDNATYNAGLISALTGGSAASSGSSIPSPGASAEIGATAPAKVDMTGNQVYGDFINTVKEGGVQNPYALAAIAATGKAESGFSPGNVNRTWDDPSASGQPGRAGGIMSWRGPRYAALAATGDLSPAGQARFFLQEDPKLIAALNNAKSVEEAQGLMNRAWAFRGYDQPGGEAARRLSLANGFLPSFQGQGQPTQVASLDPAAGMQQPIPAPEAQAQIQGPAPSAPPLPPATTVAAPPPVASVPAVSPAPVQPPAPNMQVAQDVSGPALANAIKVLSDPRANANTKAIAEIMVRNAQARQQAVLEQQLKQADPGYQADLRLKNLQADQIAHPRISPTEQANIDLNREEFQFKKDQAGLTPDINEYNFYAKKEMDAGRTPLGPLDWDVTRRKSSAGSTTINNGEGNAFYKTLDENNAKIFSNLSDSGIKARSSAAQIDQLDKLLQATGSGWAPALKQFAGNYGINTDGLSDIQAASALISKMIPAQREPGSGPVSDADLEGFRNSLPRIINQPGGNQTIINVIRGLNEYQMKQGEIADRVADRSISPEEGRRQIRDLPNPLAGFKPPPEGSEKEGWSAVPSDIPGVTIRRKN